MLTVDHGLKRMPELCMYFALQRMFESVIFVRLIMKMLLWPSVTDFGLLDQPVNSVETRRFVASRAPYTFGMYILMIAKHQFAC